MWKWEVDGQAKAVIAIMHGAYENHRWYAWLIEKLRLEGFHIVMGDLPNHGVNAKFSRVHDEDFQTYYKYTKHLIENAFSYNLPVFLIGHGLGATLLLQAMYKYKYECAGLILTSPWLNLKLLPGKLSNALTSLSALTANMKLTHAVHPNKLTRSVEGKEEMKDEVSFKSTVSVKWYRELQQMMRQLILMPKVEFPTIPVLLMTAEKDAISDSKQARHWLNQQDLSEFQYKEWANCYHNLFHEVEREEIFMYTRDFINNALRRIGYIIE
ncbi:alpha/beta hydrolase [Lysinibacillus piscis]|uniref:Phospholipase n=1 Tax=Lysinibacillus piscis TaxID=2518931 RepID=A0ABQ5NJ68_9BACI|nr:alpha/beta hydrolase [Lysinibacillus sp. KH24]GLC88158.1 phospholipase [Lysinibacillus sp. KH24]